MRVQLVHYRDVVQRNNTLIGEDDGVTEPITGLGVRTRILPCRLIDDGLHNRDRKLGHHCYGSWASKVVVFHRGTRAVAFKGVFAVQPGPLHRGAVGQFLPRQHPTQHHHVIGQGDLGALGHVDVRGEIGQAPSQGLGGGTSIPRYRWVGDGVARAVYAGRAALVSQA